MCSSHGKSEAKDTTEYLNEPYDQYVYINPVTFNYVTAEKVIAVNITPQYKTSNVTIRSGHQYSKLSNICIS